jgi:hypothetical protein
MERHNANAQVLAEYLAEHPARVDGVIHLAQADPEHVQDALTTYAALHKNIAMTTQGVRQEVLMRGLAHFATSEEIDVATFSHAMQTVMDMTRRQLGFLALMSRSRDDHSLRLSDFASGRPGVDPFATPDVSQYAVISRYKELHELMMNGHGLVAQLPPEAELAEVTGHERVELIRSVQPRDWSEIDLTRLELTAAGHVLQDALDLGELSIEIQHELLKELDPVGQHIQGAFRAMNPDGPTFYPITQMEMVTEAVSDPSRPRPFDYETDMEPLAPELADLDSDHGRDPDRGDLSGPAL